MADTHKELADSERPAPKKGNRKRDLDPKTPMSATITLKGRELPIPHADHCTLGPTEIAEKFGVPKETLQKVERVLRSYKLEVTATQGGRSLKVQGSAADICSAFQPNLGIWDVPGEGLIRARVGPLKIPSELDGIVTGVFGLDQRCMAKCHAHAARHRPPSPLKVADLEERYNFPDGEGAGQTIAIAEFGENLGNGLVAPVYLASDVESFCKSQGRTPRKIRIEHVGLCPPELTPQQRYKKYRRKWPAELRQRLDAPTLETLMDAQIVAALCPKADIRIYFSTSGEGGWVDLLDAVTSESVPVPVAVSISYGSAEEDADWSPAALTAINERLQIAALQGITVCVSSGDDGSGCGQPGRRCHVQFPSASPYVLSVGGTMLVPKPDGQVVEEAWWVKPGRSVGDGGATGGGVSALNARARWQNSLQIQSLNSDARDGRVLPDVSALAGPPYYHLLLDGAPRQGGGTSAATPLWAALIARIDAGLPESKRQRFLPPLLYKAGVATGLRDIECGHNTSSPDPGRGYHATKGFDAVSGWGVPDGRKLLDALTTA